jgi:hypothetical protein
MCPSPYENSQGYCCHSDCQRMLAIMAIITSDLADCQDIVNVYSEIR